MSRFKKKSADNLFFDKENHVFLIFKKIGFTDFFKICVFIT